MVTLEEIEGQLKRIGATFRFWGHPEIVELTHILIPGEQIQSCLNGKWEGGFAVLCATDQRLLLIDKKPMYLTMEDLRYDMISEVDYGHRLLNATIRICTPNKTLAFTAYNHTRLRQLTNYVQQRIMELRQQHSFQQTLQQNAQVTDQAGNISYLQPSANAGNGYVSFPSPQAGMTSIQNNINPYTRNPLLVRRRLGGFRSDS